MLPNDSLSRSDQERRAPGRGERWWATQDWGPEAAVPHEPLSGPQHQSHGGQFHSHRNEMAVFIHHIIIIICCHLGFILWIHSGYFNKVPKVQQEELSMSPGPAQWFQLIRMNVHLRRALLHEPHRCTQPTRSAWSRGAVFAGGPPTSESFCLSWLCF